MHVLQEKMVQRQLNSRVSYCWDVLGAPRLKSVGAWLSAGCGEVGVALVTRVCKSPRSLPGSSVGRCVAVLSEQSDNKPIVCS